MEVVCILGTDLLTEFLIGNKLDREVVRVWVFYVQSSSTFPAKQLGRDVRAECSKETERMGNKIGEGGVQPCNELTKKEPLRGN